MIRRSMVTVFLLLMAVSIGNGAELTLQNAPTQVYFSPHGGCTEAIVDALNHAKIEVLVQAYSFTSKEIAKALIDAHKRGVHVEIILDKSNRNKNGRYSAADFTAHANVLTYIDSEHPISHNKIIVLDESVVISGSFNFSRNAENNAENLMIIKDAQLAKLYKHNWLMHKKHSEVYHGK